VGQINTGARSSNARNGFDAVGNTVSRTDANGNTTTMSYDADRRLATTTAPFSGGAALVQTTNGIPSR
jgi:YD repeat-containing protein